VAALVNRMLPAPLNSSPVLSAISSMPPAVPVSRPSSRSEVTF
jgi:hypothetical protein